MGRKHGEPKIHTYNKCPWLELNQRTWHSNYIFGYWGVPYIFSYLYSNSVCNGVFLVSSDLQVWLWLQLHHNCQTALSLTHLKTLAYGRDNIYLIVFFMRIQFVVCIVFNVNVSRRTQQCDFQAILAHLGTDFHPIHDGCFGLHGQQRPDGLLSSGRFLSSRAPPVQYNQWSKNVS